MSNGLDYARIKADFELGALDVSTLAERLSDGWESGYSRATPGVVDLVEVDQDELSYLFDIAYARVVGVYGRSASPPGDYPSARMRGHPLPPSGHRMVRGHLAAHTLGGGTDINLIPQSAALNISGDWRSLERWAQARPGSFLAVKVLYDDDSQTPAHFVYLVTDEQELHYARFDNF